MLLIGNIRLFLWERLCLYFGFWVVDLNLELKIEEVALAYLFIYLYIFMFMYVIM